MKLFKMFLKKLRVLTTYHWALGFVRGGLEMIMEGDHLEVDWVKMPKDRWYADPFILDVTNEEILLLVEDLEYKIGKGVISLLHINRATMEITSKKVLLELPTHLSFPAIWRKDGHIYIYIRRAPRVENWICTNIILRQSRYHLSKQFVTMWYGIRILLRLLESRLCLRPHITIKF